MFLVVLIVHKSQGTSFLAAVECFAGVASVIRGFNNLGYSGVPVDILYGSQSSQYFDLNSSHGFCYDLGARVTHTPWGLPLASPRMLKLDMGEQIRHTA